jgi:uncharacterized membrane protein
LSAALDLIRSKPAASRAVTTPRRPRLLGIDAARGLALIGLVSAHILPAYDPQTFEPTLQ